MQRKNKMLPVIATFKLIDAALLFAVAFGFHHLAKGNAESIVSTWAHVIRADPENRHVHALISGVTGIPITRLHALEVGTFIYGLLFLTEGAGLMLGRRWAEYLTVVSTLGFLPLEIYELVHKAGHKELKAAVLIVNIAIAVYLVWNLWHSNKRKSPAA